ncbi:MAG: hypothetical protein ABSF91_08450 [Bacteroidota bacterium]
MQKIDVSPNGGILMLVNGQLLQLGSGNYVSDTSASLTDFAIDTSGITYGMAGNVLGIVAYCKFVPLTQFPSATLSIAAASKDSLFLFGQESDSTNVIYLVYRANNSRNMYRKLVSIPKTIQAVLPQENSCLLAIGGAIYGLEWATNDSISLQYLMNPERGRILSLQADERNDILYFSTDSTTCAFNNGEILEILHQGGQLRLTADKLYVLDRLNQKLVMLDNPRQIVLERSTQTINH